MLPDGTIAVSRLWKRFHADRAQRAFRDRMANISFRKRADVDRWRWVLRDIDLHLEPGASVGLVGANGSGKSTLLKILTGVMYPYAAEQLEVVGRVGALLEVRAGLHMDLTGRENIFLYGSLLGLSRAEVRKRFDDIVEFAALSDAIDRQIKFYSSGMGMRLGFSVAAFLEPDILLVDEALAVGDAFFQQRCLDRMRELLQQGTTLVLVSHDLAAVESVCQRGLWLRDGVVEADDDVRTVLSQYRDWVEGAYHTWIDETAAEAVFRPSDIQLLKAEVGAAAGGGFPKSQEPMTIDLVLESPDADAGTLTLGVTEGTATPIFIVNEHVDLTPGRNTIRCTLQSLPIPAGRFYVWIQFDSDAGGHHIPWQPATAFAVEGGELARPPVGVMRLAAVQVEASWQHEP